MLDWLKYFGLNFFSKKYARQSAERSLGNSILSFFLAIIGLYAAFCIMASSTFSTHYNKSTGFKNYYHGLFEGENALSVKLENGNLSWISDGDVGKVINTYTKEADKEYKKDGYDLVVDLRDGSALYNDCTVQFKKGSDTITYEEYMTLTEADKSTYTAKLVMTDKNIEFTPELIDDYLSFIDVNGDDEIKSKLEDYKVENAVNPENYGDVYALYYKAKYGAFGNGFLTPPTMRNYYVNTYLAVNADGQSVYDNYVILLYDIAFAAWHTDSGQIMTVSGYYGDETFQINESSTEKVMDDFLIDLFKSNKTALKVNYFLYMIRAVFVMVFIWLLLPMVIFIIAMIAKVRTLANYGALCKTMGGFWLGSLILPLLFIIIGSFYLSQTYVFYIALALFIAVDLIRTVVHYIPLLAEERIQKRQAADETQKSSKNK